LKENQEGSLQERKREEEVELSGKQAGAHQI
jgi:hypothetical protein